MSVEKMVEDAAKKVAEEGFAGEYEEGDDWVEEEEVPQHGHQGRRRRALGLQVQQLLRRRRVRFHVSPIHRIGA